MRIIDTFEKPCAGNAIYGILNIVTGRIYVGSSTKVAARWRQHRNSLRRGAHHNKYLQRSWNKHGEDNFTFVTISRGIPLADLLEHETRHIGKLRQSDGVYNSAPVGGTTLGYRHSEESITKMIRAQQRRPKRPCAPETRARIGAANKGRPKNTRGGEWSPARRAAHATQKAPQTKGLPWTPARREAHEKRKALGPTEAQLASYEAMRKEKPPKATNRRHTEETKLKQAEARRRFWRDRKNKEQLGSRPREGGRFAKRA